MLRFVLAALLLPFLVANALSQCAPGTCPEGKFCCTVSGRQSCCDDNPDPILLMRASFYQPNTTTDIVLQNGTFGCDYQTCKGTCCNSGYLGCCPIQMATCCSGGNRCCEFGNTCCGTGCCPLMSRCCGSWCCQSRYKCGSRYMTCVNGASLLNMSPTLALVSTALLWTLLKMTSSKI